VTGIELWKLYFQIRARCALTSAFDKIAGTKKNCRQTLFFAVKRFFFQANAFFSGKRFFLQETLFIEKNSRRRESFKLPTVSQGDGSSPKWLACCLDL
jgi:hypothetical protein